MISLDSVVGELHIVNGQRQGAPTFTGAFTAPRRSARGRQGDTLFMLAEGGSAPLAADLIQRIQQAYWHTAGSVTAGLRAAIESGNDWLIDRNLSSPAPARVGVTCAVLRGTEVFIAQAGPSCAYVAHQGRLERFPRGDGAIDLPPMGGARAVEMRFSHADLHPGDVLLLTDAALPMRVPEEAVASAIVYVGVETALNNLERLTGRENLIALVVEATATAPATPAAQPAPTRPIESAQPPALAEAPKVGEWARAIGHGVSRGAGSLGTAARTLVQRTLPDRPAPARQARRRVGASFERHTRLMAAVAVGIPILVAALVTLVYVQRSAAAQIDALLRDTQALMTSADTAASVDIKRESWLAALAKANEALTLQADNVAALNLRAQAQAQLDRLDGTGRVSPARLYDFKKVGGHRLAVQGVMLFVMDQRDGVVNRLALNSAGNGIDGAEPSLVVTKGFNVDERVVSDLIDMVWVDAGGARQKSALIVLERGGLVEYDPGFAGPAVVRFAESSLRPGMIRLDTFEGKLYLLDTAGRQIWKYVPSTEGYTTLPDPYFEAAPAGIENAIDMAIDGRVYLLEADGALRKYFGGEAQAFELSGLPSPIGRAVAVSVDPYTAAESSVYVADAANARILQFTPDGRFLRQIRAPGDEFAAIEDIFVDERGGRLFVIGGGQLYIAALPPAR